MLVVDTSAIVELLLSTERGRHTAGGIGQDHTLHAPDLRWIDERRVGQRLEVGNLDP